MPSEHWGAGVVVDGVVGVEGVVVVVEPDDLSIYDFNEQAARQLGYTMNEFSGLNITQIDCRLTANEIHEVWNTLARENRVSFETIAAAQAIAKEAGWATEVVI